jgi:nitrous oxidase accessory protein
MGPGRARLVVLAAAALAGCGGGPPGGAPPGADASDPGRLHSAAHGGGSADRDARSPGSSRDAGPPRVSILQRAVDGTAPGDTLVVHGGRYAGALRLRRPIALIGLGRPVLDGGGRGDVVAVEAPDVTLEGFWIRGSGLDLGANDAAVKVRADRARVRGNLVTRSLHGIYLEGASGALVEDNEVRGAESLERADRGNGIHLWNARGTVVRGNRVRAARDGLYFAGSPSNRIEGNLVEDTRIGLHYMYSDSNAFAGNVFRRNEAGAAIMLSRALDVRRNRFVENVGHRAYGLLLQTADDSRIEGNVVAGNTVGLFLDNANRNAIRGNVVAGNFLGVHLYASAEGNEFGGNAFAANEHDLLNDRGRDANEWAPGGRGNWWDENPAWDLDGDGIADAPHRISDPWASLSRRAPSAVLFTRSPALDAIALAEKLFPAFQGDAPVDAAPLAAAPARAAAGGGVRLVPALAAAGALALLGATASAFLRARRP